MQFVKILLAFLMLSVCMYAQGKQVAVTMDDLFFAFNNTGIDRIEAASDTLLNLFTKQNIPVTVFVNEKSFIKEGETDKRLTIFNKWVNDPLITIGNHTYSHKNYAEETLPAFEDDIIQGESISRDLLTKAGKKLKYFRFPFNCTGKDSVSRTEIFDFLNKKDYVIAPFTVESEDYMYNALYCDYIKKGDLKGADTIANKYIDFTMELFKYFENLSNELYGRNIKHIYLCHTNLLNTACFDKLTSRLKDEGYSFISLDEALTDNVYQSTDYYTAKFGVSWIYRWIKNNDQRRTLLKSEPYSEDMEEQYNNLMKQ